MNRLSAKFVSAVKNFPKKIGGHFSSETGQIWGGAGGVTKGGLTLALYLVSIF